MKKKRSKNTEKELVELLVEMTSILKEAEHLLDHKITTHLFDTFADILIDSSAFHELIADPKTDLKEFEPVIKRIMRKKKK